MLGLRLGTPEQMSAMVVFGGQVSGGAEVFYVRMCLAIADRHVTMPSCRVGDAHELASQRARRSRGHDDCQCSLIMMDDTLSHVYCSAQWTTWIENSRRCDCDALHCRSAHCTQLYTRPLCRDIRLGVGSGLGHE